MSEILLIGLSNHTAPLEVRERLAVPAEKLPDELKAIAEAARFTETVLVSTCNRVEIYGVAEDASTAAEAAKGYLREKAASADVEALVYERRGADAVRHAFRVTASLDSMVVGEPQILGQMKSALGVAEQIGAAGGLLGRCFSRAFGVAKRVRSETAIAEGAVSVSSIAVELAKKIFGGLKSRRVLLIGAGEMSEAAAKSLASQGTTLVVVNRSPERAELVAREHGGEARGMEHMSTEITAADIVITSTGSQKFVVTAELMHDVVKARRRRPLFLIDIAVPRDIDPRIGDMENVFLYDVDDLQNVATQNLAARRGEADKAEKIVHDETEEFERWRRTLSLTPTIVALRERFRAVARKELERTMPKLTGLPDEQKRVLEAMCDAMVNKLLHTPTTELKKANDEPDGPAMIDATRRLFSLDETPEKTNPESVAPAAKLAREGSSGR